MAELLSGNLQFNQHNIMYNDIWKPFTIQDGLDVQTSDLQRWKKVLNESTYNALKSKCEEMNKVKMFNGMQVFRGQDLLDFVLTETYRE
jgi:murein L,D-transpeptidase YafK